MMHPTFSWTWVNKVCPCSWMETHHHQRISLARSSCCALHSLRPRGSCYALSFASYIIILSYIAAFIQMKGHRRTKKSYCPPRRRPATNQPTTHHHHHTAPFPPRSSLIERSLSLFAHCFHSVNINCANWMIVKERRDFYPRTGTPAWLSITYLQFSLTLSQLTTFHQLLTYSGLRFWYLR